jgi:hypothetical protein
MFGTILRWIYFSTALCICAEEIFTEGSSKKIGFVSAFSAALDEYRQSGLRKEMDKEIAGLNLDKYGADEKLVDLIITHRLRM